MYQRMSTCELYERGLVLKQVRMFHPAIDDFQTAAGDPQYAGKAYMQMALCLRAIGRHEEAIVAFRQAVTSPMISLVEQRNILYHLGHTLESLGRDAESLEVYGCIGKDDPGFRDVARRIEQLSSGKRGPFSRTYDWLGTWMKEALTRCRALSPHVRTIPDPGGQGAGWREEACIPHDGLGIESTVSSGKTSRMLASIGRPERKSQPEGGSRTVNTRWHVRVPVRLRTKFSAKGQTMAGEGELRDLCPWGCRVTSVVDLAIGADVQCAIFPMRGSIPLIIEEATVCWISHEEFGLVFTNVFPGVQRKIVQLCCTQVA